LHYRDRALLSSIQAFFGVGNIRSNKATNSVTYSVCSIKELEVLINHFDSYPLITQKFVEYKFFKQVLLLIKSKKHLTTEGIKEIVSIRASMNKGFSDELKAAFPNAIPVTRPKVVDQEIKDPNWVAGFATGEACFFIGITKTPRVSVGAQVRLRLEISQHSRDAKLMEKLIDFLGCGLYHSCSYKDAAMFFVTNFSDITTKIIPFFVKHPILGVKAEDFGDFKKVSVMMQDKDHLTSSGLEQIRQIKAGMNKGRK
jgi:hypothetical protein